MFVCKKVSKHCDTVLFRIQYTRGMLGTDLPDLRVRDACSFFGFSEVKTVIFRLVSFIRRLVNLDGRTSFQTFSVWALLLIVHTWNSNPLQSNLLRLQCTCTVSTTSGRLHGSPLA